MSHYIRTIHTDFTTSSPRSPGPWASRLPGPYAGTSAAAHANLLLNLGGLITAPSSYAQTSQQQRYPPPGLGYSTWRTGSSGSSGARRRSNATSYVRGPHSAPAHRSPPPPPSVQRIPTSPIKFDPFSDDYALDPPTTVLYRTPRAVPASLSASQVSYSPALPNIRMPARQPERRQNAVTEFNRNERSKLVAGILLNRVHAVGKPMRRRSIGEGPREYVKSGLSTCVAVDA